MPKAQRRDQVWLGGTQGRHQVVRCQAAAVGFPDTGFAGDVIMIQEADALERFGDRHVPGRYAEERQRRLRATTTRLHTVLVVHQPFLAIAGKLERLGSGKNFPVGDHRATSAGHVSGQVHDQGVEVHGFHLPAFGGEEEVPETFPLSFLRLRDESPSQRDPGRRGGNLRVDLPEDHIEVEAHRRIRRRLGVTLKTHCATRTNGILADAEGNGEGLTRKRRSFKSEAGAGRRRTLYGGDEWFKFHGGRIENGAGRWR